MGRFITTDQIVDKVVIPEIVKEKLAETFLFAAENGGRLRRFTRVLNYCLSWGRGDSGDRPTKVLINADFTKHSYLFHIWGYSMTAREGASEFDYTVDDHPFTLAMIYDEQSDTWGTHS